ncbi:Small nuclear ribonucleoprotein-associated protein B' [Vitis vinifera]|uniref:Sm protein B n=1 Tax=Vitis vinifera TaxID=29760 RepID=A0A438H2U1_VITVI|nr:Small nuclear ribonucleoprotein-associated protein B' [Vitis vinifera]
MSMSKSSKMLQYINYRMRVTIQDGRQLVGKFMAFDRHMNLRVRPLPKSPAPKPSAPLPWPVLASARAAGRGIPTAPLIQAQPGLAGPVRGVGGPAPGMMQPQISRPPVPQLSAPPMTYPAAPVIRPPGQMPGYPGQAPPQIARGPPPPVPAQFAARPGGAPQPPFQVPPPQYGGRPMVPPPQMMRGPPPPPRPGMQAPPPPRPGMPPPPGSGVPVLDHLVPACHLRQILRNSSRSLGMWFICLLSG